MIGQAVKTAAAKNDGARVRIEAEKPDAGLSGRTDIGANIEFEKRRYQRQGRKESGADACHTKRDQANPRVSVKELEFQLRRKPRAHCFRRDRVVEKGEVEPRLTPPPRPGG